MADAISETAALFRQEISGGRASSRSNGSEPNGPTGSVFPNLGALDGDLERGGGDPEGDVEYLVDENGEFLTDEAGNKVRADRKEPKQRKEPRNDQDEDDPDADDDPDNEEDEGDEEDEDDDDPILKQKYAVMVDGEEEEMTLGEAVRGYIRQKTFHKRLSALNEAQIATNNERSTLQQERAAVAQQLNALAEELEAVMPPEPNWDELFKANPQNARNLQKQYDGLRAKITDVRQRRDKAAKEASEKYVADLKALGDSEFRRFVGLTRWRDGKQAEMGLNAMRTTAKRLGFTDEEVDSTIDSRMLMVLHKAALYDEMVGNRPRPVKDIRRSARTNEERPGKTRKSSTSVARDRNNGRFTQRQPENSIDAAAAVFERLITPGRGRRRG